MTIGATVKIKVGRWQNQTARIVEVLTDLQSLKTDNTEIAHTSLSQSKKSDITVRQLERTDFYNQQELCDRDRYLLINYGKVCLAVEGNSETLTAFTEQIQTNTTFVAEIFKQAREQKKRSTEN